MSLRSHFQQDEFRSTEVDSYVEINKLIAAREWSLVSKQGLQRIKMSGKISGDTKL